MSDLETQFEELNSGLMAEVELVSASASRSDIISELRCSGSFFAEFLIPEQLTTEFPQFHSEIWESLTDVEKERILLAIPRGHNKTTLAKLGVVWYWLFTRHRFCVYLSNTNAIATNACKDIINYLKTDNFRKVFGDVRMIKESESLSLWEFELVDADGRVKHCILRALGAGQQVRGINIDNVRPDFAVIDDVEDKENTDSELLQKKLDDWVYGSFLPAMSRQYRKILWLGNMLKKTSLLARQSRNPKWNPVVFGALVKDPNTGQLSPLWPAMWTVSQLQDHFREYKDLGLTETWMCEMMNMPGHGENGFTEEQLCYLPIPQLDEIAAAWITVDPAFGENQHNDNTAIVVHVLPHDGPPRVASYYNGKCNETQMLEEILSLAYHWNAWIWGIEAIAAQKVLITLFEVLLTGKMIAHQVTMLPLMAGKGDPKISRISSWVALMSQGEYGIPEDDIEITNQLMGYNMRKKGNVDDLIDSCAYGPPMLTEFLPLIMEQNVNPGGSSFGRVQFGTEVSNV